MQNNLFFLVLIIVGTSLLAYADEPDDFAWLRGELNGMERGNLEKAQQKANRFGTPEKQSRLIAILRKAKDPNRTLSDEEQTSTMFAANLLLKSGYPAAVREIVPLLKSESRDVRASVAQSLATSKTTEASEALEDAASQKMNQLKSNDPQIQHEAIDLIRCAILAAQQQKRQVVLERLLQKMETTIGDNPELLQRLKSFFQEAKIAIDKYEKESPTNGSPRYEPK